MSSFTKDLPKSMIPINGVPFISYQLELLKKNGVTDVILSIGYKGDVIRGYVGNGKKWGINIQYSDEGDVLRGTGGAVRWIAEQNLLPKKFFLLYGDSYLMVNYQAIWKIFDNNKKSILLTVYKNNGRWDKSNIIFENGKIILYNKYAPDKTKMNFIEYGLSIFTKKIVHNYFFQRENFDLADIYNLLSKQSLLTGYEVKNRFYEIGSQQGLKDLSDKLHAKL